MLYALLYTKPFNRKHGIAKLFAVNMCFGCVLAVLLYLALEFVLNDAISQSWIVGGAIILVIVAVLNVLPYATITTVKMEQMYEVWLAQKKDGLAKYILKRALWLAAIVIILLIFAPSALKMLPLTAAICLLYLGFEILMWFMNLRVEKQVEAMLESLKASANPYTPQ